LHGKKSSASGQNGRDGRAPLALSADGKPLTFDFTEVMPLPSFSLRLGFRDAGIDRNVHNAWAFHPVLYLASGIFGTKFRVGLQI
jgi:hypothetical protein